jgi:RimJ/RimL family protein N-acetyltransferase
MSEAATARGSEGQTFLVGPNLYLRGIEIEDAKTGPAWYPSPFPLPSDVLEERLRKEVPKAQEKEEYRLVACRRSDDRPVGSAAFHFRWWPNGWAAVYADPALGDEAGAAINAEVVGLLVPWLLLERELITVVAEIDDGQPAVAATAAEIGMRRAYRLREWALRRGSRRDLIGYEALHPAWVARLGPPPAPAEGAVEREVRAPAPRSWPVVEGDPPQNAMMVGERVYLRPYDTDDDAPKIGRWSRQETETFFDDGRHVRSPLGHANIHRKMAEEDPPSRIRFAICLRGTDELIGALGVSDVDWINRTAETESEIYRPEHRGGGLGTEAKHLLLEYAFDRIGLHAVKSTVWEPNTRSAAALRKQGYRDAGRTAWTGFKNGDPVDDLVFDLLAEEWRAARR